MSDCTPTLSHFRAVYGAMCADWCRDGSLAEFDRVIAKVRADAWDEGWSAGYTDAVDDEHPQATGRHEPNPHRIEREA